MSRFKVEAFVKSAVESLGLREKISFTADVPPRRELGDYASNVAIPLARKLSRDPLELAAELSAKIKETDQGETFAKIEVARPGFINFFLKDVYLQTNLQRIIKQDHRYGMAADSRQSTVLLEYVSANPTGPLHVGHGRWAVVGDVIARLLRADGWAVTTEFYVNNVGNQVDRLWLSVQAARAGQPVPEGGYGGDYIKKVSGETKEEALAEVLAGQKKALEQVGVKFDNFFFENSLHGAGKVRETVRKLEALGKTVLEGGAVWFKSQEMGDDKNRVLIREDGQSTYFAADIAYHLDKFGRGFEWLINIWGADHHGYVKRLKLALQALGLPVSNFEIIIGQLVTLYRDDEPVRMSKRTGEMVTLQEVVDEVGADAVRFFFAASDVNSHLDFDLELAKKKSSENPVYYVQYAHARICSILRKSENQKTEQGIDLSKLTHPAERELMLKLLTWPEIISLAAKLRQPHWITEYGQELATVFHHFYEQCRVLGDPARLTLVNSSRITLRNVLELLGISAPESM